MQFHSEHEMLALRALAGFQLLEFSLKLYISAAYQVIRSSLNGALPFDYNYKQIENFPLERLLGVFSRLNSNTSLQSRLSKLPHKRNEVAHKALLYNHDVFRDILGIDIESHAVDLAKMEKEVDECLGLLAGELTPVMDKFRGSVA
jgi:hypothetical protein